MKAKDDCNLWLAQSDAKNIRLFIQPTIGATSDFFDGSFAMRFVFVNMYQGLDKGNGFFAEPVLTGKVGFKYVKAVLQLGFSIPAGSTCNNHFDYQPFLFSIGLQADLINYFKKTV